MVISLGRIFSKYLSLYSLYLACNSSTWGKSLISKKDTSNQFKFFYYFTTIILSCQKNESVLVRIKLPVKLKGFIKIIGEFNNDLQERSN
jgi:hypothetical protein